MINRLGITQFGDHHLMPSKGGEIQTSAEDTPSMRQPKGVFKCAISPRLPTSVDHLPQLSPPLLFRGLQQMYKALDYLHKNCNVVHMDVKPSNIFVATNGDWFLGDYGSCVNTANKIKSYTRAFHCDNLEGN